MLAFTLTGIVAALMLSVGAEPVSDCELDEFSAFQATNDMSGRRRRKMPKNGKIPLIFDNDANYDDILSLVYLANHPLFDLKALTICATGMATPSQGPTNMKSILNFLGRPDVPVARGYPDSLSPIATMPLQWRVELDVWIESLKTMPKASNPSETLLSDPIGGISPYSAPALMVKMLKKSKEKVVILATGPLTNLAVALEMDPSIISKIQAVFIMGSAYGEMACDDPDFCGRNNVFNWQMGWNGAYGSCTEDGQMDELGGNFLNLTNLAYDNVSNGILGSMPDINPVRPGCRGQQNITFTGNTEWNLFMDAVAWEKVLGFLDEEGGEKVDVFALAVNATLNMPVTQQGMIDSCEKYLQGQPDLMEFMISLAEAFTGAGEAKWWDAQIAVAMSEILAGTNTKEEGGVCASWLTGVKPAVSTVWRSDAGEQAQLQVKLTKRIAGGGDYIASDAKMRRSSLLHAPPALNPYGSIENTPEASAPLSAFCVLGDVTKMDETYWPTVAGTGYPSGVKPCKNYPKCMGWSKEEGTAP